MMSPSSCKISKGGVTPDLHESDAMGKMWRLPMSFNANCIPRPTLGIEYAFGAADLIVCDVTMYEKDEFVKLNNQSLQTDG